MHDGCNLEHSNLVVSYSDRDGHRNMNELSYLQTQIYGRFILQRMFQNYTSSRSKKQRNHLIKYSCSECLTIIQAPKIAIHAGFVLL